MDQSVKFQDDKNVNCFTYSGIVYLNNRFDPIKCKIRECILRP